jgi:uncharacterized protein
MKLHPDASNAYAIQSYGPDGVVVNGQLRPVPLILCAVQGPQTWSANGFEGLTQTNFDELLPFQPELVIFGSGERIKFPAPRLLQGLIRNGIGVDTMDNGAACRTFNVLAGEGRRVLMALLPLT